MTSKENKIICFVKNRVLVLPQVTFLFVLRITILYVNIRILDKNDISIIMIFRIKRWYVLPGSYILERKYFTRKHLWLPDDFIQMVDNISKHFSIFQCFDSSPPSAAYMRQGTGSSLVQIMACRLFGAKPLSKPMLGYCQADRQEEISVKFES